MVFDIFSFAHTFYIGTQPRMLNFFFVGKYVPVRFVGRMDNVYKANGILNDDHIS